MMSGFLRAVLENLRNSVDHVIMYGRCTWVVLMQDTARLPKLFGSVLSELLSECLCVTFQVILSSHFCPV
jgi:hypothetical protein